MAAHAARGIALGFVLAGALGLPVRAQDALWFSAWGSAHNVGLVVPGLAGKTVRLVIRPTLAGQALRVKVTNIRGTTPAIFSAAFIGVAGSGAAVVPGTNRRLSFDSAPGVTLPPDGSAWSDPVPFDVTAFERLVVSLDVVEASDVSMDTLALVSTFTAPGHRAADPAGDAFTAIPASAPEGTTHEYPSWWLTAVDVLTASAAGTIVAVGDSWVDGRCSTTDGGVVRPDLYQRWIDVLAQRAAARPGAPLGVVNAGIAGNRIIPGGGNGPPTLQRLDRDVLERAGTTHVVFLQGMNDLGNGATAAAVTAAMREVVDRVHARGLRIVGGTLFPMARPDLARWSMEMEAQRIAVNDWIRAQAPFDGIIDFDALMSGGPVYEGRASLKPEFRCDDNVHPNAAGYRAMGEFVDLRLFSQGR